MDKKYLLDLIKRGMEAQKLTVPKLAVKSGIVKTTIYHWYKNDGTMSIETFFKVMEALNAKITIEIPGVE